MMKSLFAAAAASALILPSFAVPAHAAKGGNGGAVGQDPKVCLLVFEDGMYGADAGVTKAQYVPLRIAMKLESKNANSAIAYYGIGDLSAQQQASIDFYYPDGSFSALLGLPDGSDTQALCEGFMEYAESRDDEGDDD